MSLQSERRFVKQPDLIAASSQANSETNLDGVGLSVVQASFEIDFFQRRSLIPEPSV